MPKNKANYFPHDSNARNSDKLIRLRMRHKSSGYGVYFMILERLREEPDYMSVKDYNMIAFDLREDASLIKSVVEDFGLFVFTEDGKYFYSESFNKRMAVKDEIREKRSEAGRNAMKKRWENRENLTNDTKTDNNAITKLPNSDNKERKEKESKEEKEKPTIVGKKKESATADIQTRKNEFYDSLVPFVEKYGKETIREFFDYWSEMNKSQTKMRFEQEKTWELPKRLSYWARNEKAFHKQQKPNFANYDNKQEYSEF